MISVSVPAGTLLDPSKVEESEPPIDGIVLIAIFSRRSWLLHYGKFDVSDGNVKRTCLFRACKVSDCDS